MRISILGIGFAIFTNAAGAAVQSHDFNELARDCAPNIDVGTLSAVVRHESNLNPYAINVNGGFRLPRAPTSKQEAIATAEWLYSKGYSFDSGLGQYNSLNMRRMGVSIPELFEPCSNLKAASVLLTDCYTRAVDKMGAGQTALKAALTCYNTGKFVAAKGNRYVSLVAANATLPVPALIITNDDSAGVVKLEPLNNLKPSQVLEKNRKIPAKRIEGMGDAFVQPSTDSTGSVTDGIGDAFATPQAQQEPDKNVTNANGSLDTH